MTPFMNEDFLLNTETARTLFHSAAEDMPIIDYHCHISPREIWEDRQFDNITQLWLGGDHYKWRLMRAAGVEEKYITGDAPDYDKFMAWAKVLGRAAGNPLYHWSHMELQRFFGITGPLNERTAEGIWLKVNELLAQPEYSVRGLIGMNNVETICTTDDPADTLEWHEKLAEDPSFRTAVLPAWRPDKAVDLSKPEFPEYIGLLSLASGVRIDGFETLKQALRIRLAYFAERGCVLSDHGLGYVPFAPADDAEADRILRRRLAGEAVTPEEKDRYITACMLFLAGEYKRLGWVMQLHYGCLRDTNPVMLARIGHDAGCDTIGDYAPTAYLASFLGALEEKDTLPKTILYSLNPGHNQQIDALCGCFQNSEAVCNVQHGSAWWFNDSFRGITEQLESFANIGYLAGFVGMLTDSRSFLSYPRHEYFRRILCRLIGEWVEDGRFPRDTETLEEIVRAISYRNAKEYFGFAEK